MRGRRPSARHDASRLEVRNEARHAPWKRAPSVPPAASSANRVTELGEPQAIFRHLRKPGSGLRPLSIQIADTEEVCTNCNQAGKPRQPLLPFVVHLSNIFSARRTCRRARVHASSWLNCCFTDASPILSFTILRRETGHGTPSDVSTHVCADHENMEGSTDWCGKSTWASCDLT